MILKPSTRYKLRSEVSLTLYGRYMDTPRVTLALTICLTPIKLVSMLFSKTG